MCAVEILDIFEVVVKLSFWKFQNAQPWYSDPGEDFLCAKDQDGKFCCTEDQSEHDAWLTESYESIVNDVGAWVSTNGVEYYQEDAGQITYKHYQFECPYECSYGCSILEE